MGRLTHLAVLLGPWSAVGAASPQQRVEPHILSVRTDLVTLSVTLVDGHGARVNRDATPDVLKALARGTGGHAFAPRCADEVTRSFAHIAREIRSDYTIGFAPAETSEVGFQSIRVVADAGNHRQLIARTRAGYYA